MMHPAEGIVVHDSTAGVRGLEMSEARVDRAPYSDGAAFIDGRFVPVGEARVPILDWGFLRSDATYDVAHVWRGSFFRLEDHLSRFERGMERLRMKVPYGRAEIREILMECVRLSGLREAYVEVVCTRGIPPPGSRDPSASARTGSTRSLCRSSGSPTPRSKSRGSTP
jgi:branched-subunit amino acid aminotransferase/4-amino-4-deoxychorismate lyase